MDDRIYLGGDRPHRERPGWGGLDGTAPKPRCYTGFVPTTRPRHTLTETDALASALDVAARRWPEDAGARSRLLLRLVEAGEQAISDEREHQRSRRRAAVKRTHGQFRGLYGPGYLERLRDEWPA